MDMFSMFDKFMEDLFGNGPSSIYEEEVVTFIKGDYKTKITYKFNKNGVLMSHQMDIEMIGSNQIYKALKEELHKAIDEEDFLKAADIQKKINRMRELDEKKPI